MNNIVENNRLIAEFMGESLFNSPLVVFDIKRHIRENTTDEKGGSLYGIENLRYHIDWNWLMEVAQAIEEKGFVVAIKGISCAIYPLLKDNTEDYISSYVCGNLSNKIDIVYSAIIGFIKWSNQQSK